MPTLCRLRLLRLAARGKVIVETKENTMTTSKLSPEQLMDALEEMATESGFGIKSITFAPRVQPANSEAYHSFTANHLMMADFATGMQRMMSSGKFTIA